jgi:hypothetical protein
MQEHSTTKPFLTQREKLRTLMFSREGQWVPLPDVQALGIAQHGARFKELRQEVEPQGYKIENKMEHGRDGVVRSWYMLTRSARISSFSADKPLKSWEQVCAEREEKMRQPAPSFELRP